PSRQLQNMASICSPSFLDVYIFSNTLQEVVSFRSFSRISRNLGEPQKPSKAPRGSLLGLNILFFDRILCLCSGQRAIAHLHRYVTGNGGKWPEHPLFQASRNCRKVRTASLYRPSAPACCHR